jgi:hypothetical protein
MEVKGVERPKWLASLTDGSTVAGRIKAGDERWRELQKRIKEDKDQELRITQLRMQFKGRTLTCEKNARGYFLAGTLQMTGVGSGNPKQREFWGIGTCHGVHIFITWMDVLGDVWHEVRDKAWEPCCIEGSMSLRKKKDGP